MPKKIAILYRMPNGTPYVRKEKTYGTLYKQNPKTGRMTGRKEVKGFGDKTGTLRVDKDFVLVKGSSGRRGHTRKSYEDGQIVGRF